LQEEIKLGNELLKQGKLDLAQAHFKDLTISHPRDLAPLRALVRISRAQRDRVALLTYLERVLALNPDAIFEGALFLLNEGWADFDVKCEKLSRMFEILNEQKLTADVADPLMRLVQYATTGRQRIEYLTQLRSLLSGTIFSATDQCFAEKVMVAELSLALGDYEELLPAVNELKTMPGHPGLRKRIHALFYAATKIASPEFPNYEAEKVFGIGLSRTGTSSLNAAFEILGYQAMHWLNPVTRDLLHQEDFLLFDAFSDICVSHQFEWLYHTYPNSKFILTTRPVDSWAVSVERHYKNQHGSCGPSALKTSSAKRRFRNRGGQIEANLYTQYQSWPEAYAAFSERVDGFFEDKPKHRFLELSVVEGEGWERLCPFLDKPLPSVDFPNLNAGRGKK
jgi:hypothetical protein